MPISGNLYLPHGGQPISCVVGHILVGRGADLIVIDDPIAPARVDDGSRRGASNKWFDAEVIQRLNDDWMFSWVHRRPRA